MTQEKETWEERLNNLPIADRNSNLERTKYISLKSAKAIISQEIQKAREEGRQLGYSQGKSQNEAEILSAIQQLNKIINNDYD